MGDAFLAYLKKSGCEEALWKALIELDKLQNKLENPVEFIRLNLDKDLNERYKTLRRQIAEVRKDVLRFSEENPTAFAKYLKMKKKKAKRGQILAIEKALRKEADKPEEVIIIKETVEESQSEKPSYEEILPQTEEILPQIEEVPIEIPIEIPIEDETPAQVEEIPSEKTSQIMPVDAEQDDQLPTETEPTEQTSEPIILAEPPNEDLELKITNEEYQNALHQEVPPESDFSDPDHLEGDSLGPELNQAEPELNDAKSETSEKSLPKESPPEKGAESTIKDFEENEKVKRNKFLCC